MNVNPGELNKRITIFRMTEERDSDALPAGKEEKVRECWASFHRMSGSEKMAAGIDMAKESCRFLCRYSDKVITPQMFIRYNKNIYNIVFVNDYEDSHEYIEIHARRC